MHRRQFRFVRMLPLSEIGFVGTGLNRPECVLAHSSGLLFASDWTGSGGIAIVAPDGSVTRHLARNAPRELKPNGIVLEAGGSFLLAELRDKTGGVWRLQPDGSVEPVLLEVDGRPLPPVNFIAPDAAGRLWITVSTRHQPRHLAARADIADGFIVLLEGGRARIVADRLGYTNECLLGADGRHLFVNETFARRVTRFKLTEEGLGERTPVASFGAGTFPDGLALDVEGGLWITSIVSNRVIRLAPDGREEIVVEDADPGHVAWVEAAYAKGELDRQHLGRIESARLRNVSSLAFGGPDLRTAYLGCLLGDRIARFAAPVAGAPPLHWRHDLGTLTAMLSASSA
jgi:sugar lactone lactonase YvrE